MSFLNETMDSIAQPRGEVIGGMDITTTPSLSNEQKQSVISSRPVIPPKPKSSDSKRNPDIGASVCGTSTSTVGTQVNLLSRRKSKDIGRTGDLKRPSNVEIVAATKPNKISEESKSLPAKPAIPPKPIRTSPKKSDLPTPVTPFGKGSVNAELNFSPEPPSRINPPLYASIEELKNFEGPIVSTQKPSTAQPKDESISNEKKPAFFYPDVSLRSGLKSNERVEGKRKSTSLGRNTIFSPFKSSGLGKPSTVSHLDLTTTARLVSQILTNDLRGPETSVSPPPPPPRRRNSQKLSSTAVPSKRQSEPVTNSSPLYAVVDMEKKWEMRRLNEEKERRNNNAGTEFNGNITEPVSEVIAIDITNENVAPQQEVTDTRTIQAISLSTASITSPGSSWLEKFIIQNPTEDESIPNLELSHTFPDSEETDTRCSLQHIQKSSLGVNDSFLFNYVKSDDTETSETSTTTLSPTTLENKDESDNSVEQEKEDKTCDILPDNESRNLVIQDAASDQVYVTVEGNDLHSQKTDDLEVHEIFYDSGSGEASARETEDTDEIKFEKLLEENLEPTLSPNSVAETKNSTEDVQISHSDSDAALISEIVRSQEQFKFSSRKSEDDQSNAEQVTRTTEDIPKRSKLPMVSGGSFRRRSWTCSEKANSSLTESSPTSSSSSLRERTTSVSGSLNSQYTWVDEGELSTGALGDTENSDACHSSSIDDFNLSGNRPFRTSSISKRKRMVNGFFASFGKAGASSSSSQSISRKVTGVRIPSSGKRKEKSKSHFFLEASIRLQKEKKGKTLRRSENLDKLLPLPTQLFKTVSGHIKEEKSVDEPMKSHSPSYIEVIDSAGESQTNLRNSGDSASSISESYDQILSGMSHKERQAFYVAREVLTSERTFVNVLNLLTVEFPCFVKTKERHLGYSVIRKSDLDFILGGLPNLKRVNETLLMELEDRIASWKSNPKISDIIIRTAPFLKHYSSYIKDYQKIYIRFEQIVEKNANFALAVAEFEKLERCKNLKLKHYLLKPVQRMPQYALLLGDYLKNLDNEEHPDYEDTKHAITIVKEVAVHGNEAIRVQENAERLIELQNRLPQSVILKPGRTLICEGELRKVCRKELQPRYFALMSDCLFCLNYAGTVNASGNKELRVSYNLPLAGMRVAVATSEDYQNEFSVISITRSFNLVAKTPKERDDWLKALDQAIKANIKSRSGNAQDLESPTPTAIGKVAPVWIADSRVTMCQACTAEFTITFRRHHCRACGKVVCGNCSGNEAPLVYLKGEANRVCDYCYSYLLEEFDNENQHNSQEDVEMIRNRFKKGTPNMSKKNTKHKRSIPTRLEIHGNSVRSAVSGYLHWKEHRKAWKKQWFVLHDRVLYVYAASEDIAAVRSIPILGYEVEVIQGGDGFEGDEGGRSIFQLTHSGQDPYIFQAENSLSAEKWIAAMREATILK